MTTHSYNTRFKSSKSIDTKNSVNKSTIMKKVSLHEYNTRSKKKQELKVDIDFDDASVHWRKNKYYLRNGCFRYKSSC